MTEPRVRRRPAPLARIAIAGLSATSMFTIVTLLAIRGQEAATPTATTTASTVPPRQVIVYVTDPPVDAQAAPVEPVTAGDPAAPAASGDPVGEVAAGGTPDPSPNGDAGGPAPSPVAAASPAPAPVPAAPAPAQAPAPTTAAPAPSTGTGGS